MLPQKTKIGVSLGLLIFCLNSVIVKADIKNRSNNWHDGPINCYTCDSAEECAQSKGLIQKCEDNDSQTCVTVFSELGVVSQRGCSDRIITSQYNSYCNTNPTKCPHCSSSGCNDATSMDQFVECLSCDSSLDKNCVLKPSDVTTKTMCDGQCMTGLYATSSDDNPGYNLVRSCLNDRDIDDRSTCLDGSDSNCVGCSGANCNVVALPDNRHSCYRCIGSESCEDPEIEECTTFKEDDQCFMRFESGSNDIVELGCLSDYNATEDIIDLVKQKLLLICDGLSCNGFENLPQNYECTECSSNNLEACATRPITATAQQTCRVMPYTQCYQRINGEATERGCLSDLEGDEFYNCLTGDDEKCKVCKGNNCNEEIIPSDRKRCQRCNSESDTLCHSAPAASSICPSYNAADACVAVYENGVTKRGCQSEFTCNADSKTCQICSQDGCNTLNIKKRHEEIYGIFQDLPLNCNTCSGNDCQGDSRNPNKCEGDAYQDCMTVFDSNGEVVRRGCENLVLAEYQSHCDTNPELCFTCKANGCNDMTNPTSYQQCLYCDAASNPECLFNPSAITTTRKCALGCVASLYPRKSNPKVLDFVRTCFEDIEPDNRDACTAEDNCVKCTTDKCNTDILPTTERLSCLYCDGADCDVPQSKQCTGYTPDDQCYMYFDNVTHSAIRLGCRSDVTPANLSTDIKQYFLCDGDNCNDYSNIPEAKFCYSCDSESDENCAVDPSKLTVRARCGIYPHTQCFTRIRDDGHTARGCLYSLPTDVFISCNDGDPNSKCRICTDDNCNKNIYPSNRQQCYRCDSSSDSSCESEPSTVQACPTYNASDACVTQLIDGVTRRACASEITCNGLSRKNCRTCSGSGCNSVNLVEEDIGLPGLFQGLPLNCYHCNGTDECQASNGLINVCSGNSQQTCTTAFNEAGDVTARGCSDSLDSLCSAEGNQCYDCKSNGCNLAKVESDFIDCVKCDAQDGDDCIFNVDEIKRTRKCYKSCMTALYPRTHDDSPVYELIRTCLDDKDLDDRDKCDASLDARCKSCTGANCNKDDLGTRKSCYHCQGDDCQIPKTQTCRGVMDKDQCFVQWNEKGEVVELGCKSKYDPTEVETLVKAQFLWLCDADNCNEFENTPATQTCVICNSRTDSNCSINPAAVTGETICDKIPYTQCYSRVLESGHTERGCLSNLEDDEFYNCLNNKNSTECLSCVGGNCNEESYPSNRLTCQVCSSATSDSCETSPNSPQNCLLYSRDDKCVSSIDTSGNTVRGCSSQVTCDTSDSANCQVCEGSNCNVANLKRKSDGKPGQWQSLPLSCLACNNLEDCKAGHTQQTCLEQEYCMTVFNSNGEVVRRGCSDAVEQDQGSYCDLNSENCFNCNSNLCNVAQSLGDYIDCVYCDSESNPDCALNPSDVGKRRKCKSNCMTALYPVVNSSVYEVVRTCLDDKDLDDQSVCLDGSSTECKACSGSACNTDMLPENRLSCYSCQGDNCEDAQTAQCLKYKPDDQCFMLYDKMSDIIQMGCVSDLEDSFVSSNMHRLYMCSSGNNCNSYENAPTLTMCAVCNSKEDPDCASNPQNVPNVIQCTDLPNTQCYTRVNTDGSTDRGCVGSLNPTQMLSCLGGNATNCNTCESDRCNIAIFPADRHSCQRCNTKDSPDCESSPDFASVCPVYSTSQYCATKLVNEHTYRGCSTEFECDDSDKQYCRSCYDSDNCNVVDLVSSNIGYPGNWQGVPINCYTCKDDECQDNKLGLIQVCANNNLQNCVAVFAQNGSVVERGCSDLIYSGENSNYCDKNPGYCKFCKSNGCNLATSLGDFGDCLFCDGSDTDDCVFNPENIKRTRTCHKGCMTGLYPRSNEENPAYELARGCLDDLDLDDREECRVGTKPYCQVCEGSSCNTAKIPTTRLECNVCIGADCEDPKSAVCTAFRENDQCFILFEDENDVQRMGCASDLDNSFLVGNVRKLFLCSGDNCNTFDNLPSPVSCSVCNSVDNPECASGTPTGTAAVCQALPYTECYTHIDKDGSTHRGCLSDVDDNLFNDCSSGNSTTCEVCSSNNCNSNIYPEGRRSCIQCDSALFPACEDNASNFANICRHYNENDSCVTKLEGDRTIRGCSSEFTCDTSSRDTCRICNSTDNCNTVNLLEGYIGEPGKWQGLPLNCYNCEGDECTNGLGLIGKCEGNNLQTCTTVFDSDGAVVKRGCSDAVTSSHSEYCDENSDKCISCKSNGCNNAQSLNDFIDCYYCDSLDSANCSINFVASSAKTRKCQKSCAVAMYPRSSNNDPSYELVRTCLDDLDLDDREACANGDMEFCKACDGSRCNTMNVPEERFECYKCTDDDCEDMEPQECSAHHPNDQCYVLYNTESSIIGMGCRSEFEMDVVTELVKQKQMLLCNEKNCNTPVALPTPKTCSVCYSGENSACATNPNLVGNSQRCSALPYTECFTRVNSIGHTERGCLGSLPNETFYGCLMNTDSLCETCVGDKCNEIDVYPGNRRKCQQCNSATDPLCASAPNSNSVCEVYDENDYCVTNLRNGITTRGCSTSMKCDNENDPRTCRTCNDDGCNTVNMEKVGENGEPGRWQDIPITCYSCKGEEDCVNKGDFRSCVNNPLQNCMTVFNDDGKVIQRGCSDIVEADNESYCEANPEQCKHCNSNACNVATKLSEYVECLACDTDSNGQCFSNVAGITKTRQCYKHCMTALYPRFQEENPSLGLTRSCYDDMDPDDRELCEAGNKENCQVCSEAKCNVVNMPATRLSCNMCEGDNCQDPKSEQCPFYRSDDKCYVRFDEKVSVVAMGCRSEFSNSDADYLLKQKRLHLCDSDNCNTFDKLPVSQTCALCNSRTDSNCSVNPSAVTGQTTCAVLPITECYSRVLSDGATERGCLSNLYDDEFLGCLNGTSATCESCQGNNCNKNVFPESRLKCHICDSSVDPTCTSAPNSLSICPNYESEDTCVTSFRNDITYRGCSSNLVCDATNPRSCLKCSGEGCNTANLARKQDDNFGKWQDLPLTCLSCTGSNCDSSTTTESLICELNNEQDCMTVFDNTGKVVRRGCADIVESEYSTYCEENDDSCFSCKSNECNTAIAKTEFVECVYCNSHKDLECVWNPSSSALGSRQCQGSCMTALFPSDNSATPAYDLIRTCLNDKELANQTTCSGANCKSCTGSKCNIDNVPENRLSCLTCEDGTCEDPESKSCPLYKEIDQCFIKFDDSSSVVEMGCVSSFRNQDLESIIKTKRVSVCSGSNCNTFESIASPKSCAVCNSTDDVSCAVNPIEIGSFNTCRMQPYTSCYSKLLESGTTERGCLTDLPADDFAACVLGTDKNCGVCNEDGCNREIFPADRQQCYTCNSEEESNCESFPASKLACPLVNDSEACMTALSGNVTIRGCKSSIFCDANDSSTCRSCIGSECNSIDLFNKVDDGYHGVWQDLPLKCHTCEGEHCLHSLGPTVTCSSRNIQQDCMTVFNSLGHVINRGCSDDVEDYRDLYCRQNPEMCFKCKSNECNIAWSASEYVQCAFCDSATDALCVVNPENAGFGARKCYKECMVAMKDQQVIRSCLDDKELFVQNQCHLSNSMECATCTDANCNKFIFPEDRLKCHVCTGSSCTGSVGQYCQLYDSNDYCFAKYENGKVDLMGCATAQNASDITEWTAQNKLFKCEGNDCNELSRLPQGGTCLSCDSSKSPNCVQNPLVTSTETCLAPSEKCVTKIDSQGHTIRGCFSSLDASEQTCEAKGTCAVCTGDKCNSQIYPANRRECHICNSVADSSCAGSPSSIQVCPVFIENDSCVSALSADGILTRGCGSQVKCDNTEEDYCNVCNSNGCNTVELKGAAGLASSSLILTLLLAFVSLLVLKH